VLIGAGHLPKSRVLSRDFVCVSHADAALYEASDVLAERFSLVSSCCNVSFFLDTDHFSIVFDHAWDIARRIRCGVD